ncbi:MAG: ABC transporter permease [Candidatus Planktophila sp.]
MFAYISRRLGVTLLILLGVSFTVYVIFAFLPFDPAALTCGKNCNDPGIIEANRKRLGYDLPFLVQYWVFIKGLFIGRTYGEGAALINCPAPSLGYSFQEHSCVTTLIGEALPVTLSLALGALVLWLVVGVGLGVLAARYRGKFADSASTVFVLIGTSLPTFLTGLMLLVFVVIKWRILPFPAGNYTPFFEDPYEWAQILFLPWITLAFAYAALYTRFVRSAVIETSNEDYIRTARAKGLPEGTILGKHTLRAALAPIVTMAGLDFAGLLGGAILTESVFNLPGLGRLAIGAVREYDLPIIVATTLLAAAIVVIINLIVDIAYAFIDPRVRIA